MTTTFDINLHVCKATLNENCEHRILLPCSLNNDHVWNYISYRNGFFKSVEHVTVIPEYYSKNVLCKKLLHTRCKNYPKESNK